MNINGETFVPWEHFRFQLVMAASYREALERILAHWNKPDGEIDPALMARIAEEAIKLTGSPG